MNWEAFLLVILAATTFVSGTLGFNALEDAHTKGDNWLGVTLLAAAVLGAASFFGFLFG